MRPVARWLWYWLPVLAWMGLILAMSGRSDLPVRQNPQTGEVIKTTFTMAKIAHVVEYAGLALLLLRAVAGTAPALAARPLLTGALVVVVATGFGAIDEGWQSFTPLREPRLADVLLDGAAALAAATGWLLWRRRRASAVGSRAADRVAPTAGA